MMTYKEALQIYKDTVVAWGGLPDECDESKSEYVQLKGLWMWKIYYKDKEDDIDERRCADYFYIQDIKRMKDEEKRKLDGLNK